MRKLKGGGESVGTLAYEVAGHMSRAASLWRALEGDPVGRLREEVVRLEGVRRLVVVDGDDDALLALTLAEMAGACRDLARAVVPLSGRCVDPLLRRFGELFASLVAGNGGADPHGLRYAAAGKMDRKARKMQRLVAATGHLCQELEVLAELEQGARLRRAQFAGAAEAARRVERQRKEVDRLRAASLWNRSFDYAVRLLARSLFTIVSRIIEAFGLEPKNVQVAMDDDYSMASLAAGARLSFVGSTKSLVYPSDSSVDAPQRSGKLANGDARRVLLSRSQSLRRQLKWPAGGKNLIGCMVSGRSKSPVMQGWNAGDHESSPLSFSYFSGSVDDFSAGFQSPEGRRRHRRRHSSETKLSAPVFDSSSHDVAMNAPATTLGGAALASRYANIVVFVEKLAVSPRRICPDERDALYGMLTDRLRASLRARLRPPPPLAAAEKSAPFNDAAAAAEWAGAVQGILGWLAPLAHNMVRWRSERSFEHRSSVGCSGGGAATGVLLLQTLHYADQEKTEAAIAELLVGLNYLWRYETELDATSAKARLEQDGIESYYDCAANAGQSSHRP